MVEAYKSVITINIETFAMMCRSSTQLERLAVTAVLLRLVVGHSHVG
jgi:hypothetical protein